MRDTVPPVLDFCRELAAEVKVRVSEATVDRDALTLRALERMEQIAEERQERAERQRVEAERRVAEEHLASGKARATPESVLLPAAEMEPLAFDRQEAVHELAERLPKEVSEWLLELGKSYEIVQEPILSAVGAIVGEPTFWLEKDEEVFAYFEALPDTAVVYDLEDAGVSVLQVGDLSQARVGPEAGSVGTLDAPVSGFAELEAAEVDPGPEAVVPAAPPADPQLGAAGSREVCPICDKAPPEGLVRFRKGRLCADCRELLGGS